MDSEEFRRWYETVASNLFHYIRHTCGNEEEAEDVFQETFVRLLGSKFTSDDLDGRRRYVFRIATNLIRDRRRWTRRWGLGPLFERSGHSPESSYTNRLDVETALSRIPKRSRALLWLAYVIGQPHKEIAEILDIAPTSVRVLLSRARKRFLESLERNDL